jgi:hypothetical protein
MRKTIAPTCVIQPLCVACALLAALAVPAQAQEGPAAPELQPLARYIGTWRYEGEDKTPLTGGRVTCTSTRRWISGGYFVESHRSCETPRGRIDQVEVYGYDFQNRQYVYWGFSGRVLSSYGATTLEHGKSIWTGFAASAGNRCTAVFADPDTSSDMCETSTDGGTTWILRSAGSSRRVVPVLALP